MEHYPDIQRQQGTLFFIPHGDSAAIAMSIERLINLLDAAEGDPDLEPDLSGFDHQTDDREDDAGDSRECDFADDEPSLGAEERHPHIWCAPHHGDQSHWAYGAKDDREDDGDDLEPDVDDEYSNGWTAHIDQTKATACNPNADSGEGEPTLGFVGISTGWREGEDVQDREADQLGDSECERDDAEHGICDEDGDTCLVLTAAQAGLVFDGTGTIMAADRLLRAKPRREPYSEIIGVRHHQLQDGSVFTTLVPR